jgi:CheY-like chemotaxis protein
MNILIIEDDEDKRTQLIDFVNTELGASVTEAKSVQGGLKALLQRAYDLIFLDMTMSTYDITPTENGGRPQPFAGREILSQMARRKITTRVIVITQFDRFGPAHEEVTLFELDEHLRQSFPQNYLGAVFYSVTYTGWQENLLSMLQSHQLMN